MDHSTAQSVGVDVSKDFLDVALYPAGSTARFANDAKGYRALVTWLNKHTIERVIFEATGAYHRAFERALAKAGLPMVKVNPRQARRFAEAIGKLAKTDRIDAAMLARMGMMLNLTSRPIVSQALDEMKELLVARDGLVKDRTANLIRAKEVRSPLLKRQIAQRIKQIEAQIGAIEKQLVLSCQTDPDLKQRFELMQSIPSIGPVTAMALLIEMPELGTLDQAEVASLAGLAPFARESGSKTAKRFIRGGRARLRRALYMPALAAIRCNPDFRAKYKAMIKAGKPKKLAIVAIMRKLIILVNALVRDRRKWAPQTA
jgi:transposase